MKTLILFLVLSAAAFGQDQELLDDSLRITTEKWMRKGEWSHSEAYGWETYDCNRRFFYRCNDKADMDTIIISLLKQYGVDPEDEGQQMINDRRDSCHMWQAKDNGWDVSIHTYKNQWDRWMIYIRFD
jgi:hypothetical protein